MVFIGNSIVQLKEQDISKAKEKNLRRIINNTELYVKTCIKYNSQLSGKHAFENREHCVQTGCKLQYEGNLLVVYVVCLRPNLLVTSALWLMCIRNKFLTNIKQACPPFESTNLKQACPPSESTNIKQACPPSESTNIKQACPLSESTNIKKAYPTFRIHKYCVRMKPISTNIKQACPPSESTNIRQACPHSESTNIK